MLDGVINVGVDIALSSKKTVAAPRQPRAAQPHARAGPLHKPLKY